jgi:hypothetical protein
MLNPKWFKPLSYQLPFHATSDLSLTINKSWFELTIVKKPLLMSYLRNEWNARAADVMITPLHWLDGIIVSEPERLWDQKRSMVFRKSLGYSLVLCKLLSQYIATHCSTSSVHIWLYRLWQRQSEPCFSPPPMRSRVDPRGAQKDLASDIGGPRREMTKYCSQK